MPEDRCDALCGPTCLTEDDAYKEECIACADCHFHGLGATAAGSGAGLDVGPSIADLVPMPPPIRKVVSSSPVS